MRLLVITLSWVIAMAGCSPSPVITVKNRAPVTLISVVVSGSGFSHRLENIATGAEGVVTVNPRGESDLRLSFDAGNRHIDVGDLAYIEGSGGYRVAVTVASDLGVSAMPELKGY